MKKGFGLFFLFAILLSSCQTVTKTARTADISSSLHSVAVADLEVADQRVTHTMTPSKEIRRGGLDNIKQAVEYEALTKHGNADVLLEPQYVISKKRTLFGSKITSISVSGRPAYYKNFRTLNDSVWSNPVFRGVKVAKRSGFRKRSYAVESTNSVQSYRSKGFAGYVTPFIGHGMIDIEADHGDVSGTQETFTMAALLSGGYQLNSYLYLGIGAGIDYEFDGGEVYIPFFVNPRLYFSKKKKALFYDLKIGYSINTEDDGGLFAGWALGYSFGKMDLAFQLLHYERVGEYEYRSGWYEDDCDIIFNQVGLSLGIKF